MWLKRYRTMMLNGLSVAIGDPFFLVLHLTVLLLIALLGVIPGFTHGEHMTVLRDQCQALIFIIGCLCVCFGLIRVLTDDIRRGAGPVLRSRPIGAQTIIYGKWCGVVAGVTLLYGSAVIGYLWISEVAFDDEYLNTTSLAIYLGIIGSALLIGAIRHYLLGGSYVFHTNYLLIAALGVAFAARVAIRGQGYFDWPGLQSSVILLFAVVSFAAFMAPIAVIADSAVVLAMGVVVFLLGLVTEHVANVVVRADYANVAFKALLPNWQNFWVADRLGAGEAVPLGFLAACGLHALLFALFYTTLATVLYERMETTEHV